MINKNQIKHMEHPHYLSSLITDDASCTLKIIFRLPWKRQHSEEYDFFSSKLVLNLGEMFRNATFGAGCLWRCNLNTTQNKSEIPETI
jgi:hypothetical protein